MSGSPRHIVKVVVSVGVAAGVIGGVSVIGGSGSAGAANGSGTSAKLSSQELSAGFRSFAAANGEGAPTAIIAAETTRRTALAITDPGTGIADSGSGLDQSAINEDVFVITATGRFTGHLASVPPGSPTPTGSVLTMVVDAHTGEVMDWGLTDTRPPVDRAGPVMTLG